MSLNKIDLNPQLLSALYADVLVETDAIEGPESVRMSGEGRPISDDRQPTTDNRQPTTANKAMVEKRTDGEIKEKPAPEEPQTSNLKPPTAAEGLPQAQQTPPSKFLGNNGKNIAVLVRHEEVPFLPDGELSFLTNILSACRLGLGDVAITNVSGMEAGGIMQVMESLGARTVLMFGIAPLETGLPIAFPHFQAQQFNKRTYLYSPDLSEIESDKNLKAKLWASLKNLFSI